MTKVFLAGSTGYIGNTILVKLVEKHPDYEITALVRNEETSKKLKDAFPGANLETVVGDLDSADIIKEAASKADVAINVANGDHVGNAQAIIDGLGQQSKKVFYLHASGGFHYIGFDESHVNEEDPRLWDDIEHLQEILDLPVDRPHGPVDHLVLDQPYKNVHTAIVDPTTVYGTGLSKFNNGSIQIPWIVRSSLKNKKAISYGEGNATSSAIHVLALADAFVLLTEEAAKGGGRAQWGYEGWYNIDNDKYQWIDISKEIGRVGKEKGYFETDEVEQVGEDAKKTLFKDETYADWAQYFLNSGAYVRGSRLRQLGWNPQVPGVIETVKEVIEVEAKKLGLSV